MVWARTTRPVMGLPAGTAGLKRQISITMELDRENFNLDSTHQAGQVRNKERNTGEHREPQADVEQQGWETPPHKPEPPAELGEGLARALEVGGPGRRSRGPPPAERGGRAVKAPPGRTPAVGARRASAAGSEEPEAATEVGRRRDAQRPVHRASENRRWRGAVDNLPLRVRTAQAPPGECGPGEGGGDTGDTAPGDRVQWSLPLGLSHLCLTSLVMLVKV